MNAATTFAFGVQEKGKKLKYIKNTTQKNIYLFLFFNFNKLIML